MIIGHQHIINYLKKSIEKNRISHAYLFTGPEQAEKKKMALWFAEFLGCKKPDITEISVSENKKEISIEQIRELRRYLSLSPHSSPYKIAIIEEAENMNSESVNALLKTLEEPKGKTILILISNISSALPDTIISRCEEIKFRTGSLDKLSKDFIKKEHIDILQEPLNDKFRYVEKISSAQGRPASGWKESSQIVPLLDSWLFWFRDLLIQTKAGPLRQESRVIGPRAGKIKYSQKQLIKIIKEIQKTKNLILNTNINQRLALENLILCINSY